MVATAHDCSTVSKGNLFGSGNTVIRILDLESSLDSSGVQPQKNRPKRAVVNAKDPLLDVDIRGTTENYSD
jgi:hypothetical protein